MIDPRTLRKSTQNITVSTKSSLLLHNNNHNNNNQSCTSIYTIIQIIVNRVYIVVGILYLNYMITVFGLHTIQQCNNNNNNIHNNYYYQQRHLHRYHNNKNRIWMWWNQYHQYQNYLIPKIRKFSVVVHSSCRRHISSVGEKSNFFINRRKRKLYWLNDRYSNIMSKNNDNIQQTTGKAMSNLYSTNADNDDTTNNNQYDTVDYYSLESLQHRVANYVQQQHERYLTNNDSNNNKRYIIPKFCIVIAGGGGHLLSTIASTPGASSILLDGTIPYSRQAFQQYISTIQSNEYNNNNVNTNESSSSSILSNLKYCSAEAGQLLADAACQKAIHLTTTAAIEESYSDKDWTQILRSAMGVACTSVLQSTIIIKDNNGNEIRSTSRSVEKYGSRAYCTIQTSYGIQIQLHVQLAKDIAINNTTTTTTTTTTTSSDNIIRTRSRFDEDVFVSHCILSCIEICNAKNYNDVEKILNIAIITNTSPLVSKNMKGIVMTGHTLYGDELKVILPSSLFVSSNQPMINVSNTNDTSISVDYPLQIAADRILSGRDEVVTILLPSNNNYTVEVMHTTQLPPYSLVVPGSFNPIHIGHIALALAAAKEMSHPCTAIWFELSITNVDKPALAIDTIIERIKYFFPYRNEIPDNICWGILLTNAPLFKQKVELLAPLQLDRNNSILHFSIGTDTLVRLIDPKYYNNSQHDMLQALNDMSCHFMVGGRLDQKRLNDSIFITGDEVVESLPPMINDKFTILPNFRIDLSSTEIRQKMETEKQTK